MKTVEELFRSIVAVDYRHPEGGRYAYVQLMALVRDLRLVLQEDAKMKQEVHHLEMCGDLLNGLVHFKFEKAHELVFYDQLRMLREMRLRLLTGADTAMIDMPLSSDLLSDAMVLNQRAA